MSRDAFRQYVPGQPFDPTATQLNAWTAAARAHAQHGRDSDLPLPTRGIPHIRNETGETLSRFAILGITDDGVIVDADPTATSGEFFDSFVFRGEKPDPDKHQAGQIAIVQLAAIDNQIVECVVSGTTPVKVDVPDGETYRSAELIADDATKLMASDSGPIPLAFPVTGPGEKWGVANLGGGGSCDCPIQIEFYTEGGPTAGTFTWRFNNQAANDLVINFDDTTTEVVTAMNALPLFDGVTAVTPGTTALPSSSVIVELASGDDLPLIEPQENTLDDGLMKVRYRP